MRRVHRHESLIKRFCDYMGGQNVLARLIERIAQWILMPPRPALAGAVRPPPDVPSEDLKPKPMEMASGPGTGGPTPNPAPTTPHGSAEGGGDDSDRPGFWNWFASLFGGDHDRDKTDYDTKHSADTLCKELKYHGMHGRPCKYEGGSDTKCPTGTVSGWFWYYDVPALGRIYYVDCCGKTGAKHIVWCNWTNEQNWCKGIGRAEAAGRTSYFCTLAIPDATMKTRDLGGGRLEVAGVDP